MAPLGEPDETLMARTADGDRACLELLVRRHATPLLTFLARQCGDRHRAEELFQEVFLAVWVKRRLYQSPRPFRPWLYAIALNKCRAAFRVRPGPAALTEDGPTDAGTSPADAVVAAETADLVGRAVARLPEQQRAVVTLARLGGTSLRPHRRDRRLLRGHGALAHAPRPCRPAQTSGTQARTARVLRTPASGVA